MGEKAPDILLFLSIDFPTYRVGKSGIAQWSVECLDTSPVGLNSLN